ncbi:MAG: hypothetical protein H0W73_13005 [Bacteroidetes bacterium]|nr:hypothetical protein [Bacteroidota bacterium]
MNQFVHLLKHDFILLQRNKIIGISALITVVYMAVFKGLSHFGSSEKILVLVIFNDPALLGFLFVGVMVLFEKNENTLQVLSITPMKESNYLLSKATALSIISLVCCFAMAIAGVGGNFNFTHYFFASLFTTLLFAFLGFIIVVGVNTFNRFILKAVGLLILLSTPFLGYYDVVSRAWFLWIPTQPCVDLFSASFDPEMPIGQIIYGYIALTLWLVVTYIFSLRLIRSKLKQ